MIYNAEEYARLRNVVLSISLIAWIVILAGQIDPRVPIPSCCLARSGAPLLERLLSSDLAASLATGWVVMLVAMMAPMLVAPIYHIRISSFARRRARATAFFIAGYAVVWMTAGVVMLAAELAAITLARQSYLPAIFVGLVALVWQTSPFKQRCLNRCHGHPPLSAYGAAADRDALRMGLEHGGWCTGSCWATMLFPMLLPEGHFIAMAAVSVLMFCERLDPPSAPAWVWRGFGTASRYLSLRLLGPRCGRLPSAPGAAA
jgi:predicted metal-binding membrane protein